MKALTQAEFIAASKQSSRICLYQEIAADYYTPIGIFKSLANRFKNGTILESGIHNPDNGKYSYIGLEPFAQLVIKDKEIILKEQLQESKLHDEPLKVARQCLKKFHCSHVPPLAKFIGGSAGFISYDAARLFENIPNQHQDTQAIPDMLFNFYRICITFDHQHQKCLIALAVDITNDPQQAYINAKAELAQIIEHMSVMPKPEQSHRREVIKEYEIDISDQDFADLVSKAKQYVVAGDAFQIVLSRSFKQKIDVPPFEIYRALRYRSPAPYMFFIDNGDTVILGASPEKLVSLEEGVVSITPIAGTRPRIADANDSDIIDELTADEKEAAEHMMLVDLARNDIGAVCKAGTVKVVKLKEAKVFSHVIHLVSLVEGELDFRYDALDVIKSTFPAGTLSGAPKIRAMEIIDELEQSRRGLYGGAIFFIDHLGNLDSCIAIRMAVVQNGQAIVRAGAGVVFDSDPQLEAQETKHKAKSVLEAIKMAAEGSL